MPRLADHWEWADTGTKLRVTLRPGVQTHAGPLTATLVADALRTAATDPSNQSVYWSLRYVQSVDVTGDAEVTITLSRPTGTLPEDLDLPLDFGSAKAGTGPFRLVTESDRESVLERFDDYYRSKPGVTQVAIRPYPTLRTAWTSLLRGDVDMVTNVPANAIEFLQSDRVVVASFPRVYQYAIAYNSARPPFDSPQVRRALNLAVDRPRLLSRIFAGRGLVATSPLWPNHWAYDPTLPAYRFAPREAAAALDAAGLPVRRGDPSRDRPARFRFTCIVPAGFVIEERIALEVEKQFYDIGVAIAFDVVEAREYVQRLRTGNFDAALLDLISGPTFGRPYMFWHSRGDERGFNFFGYDNPTANTLFDQIRESTDEVVVRDAVHRLQRVFDEDPPALFLVWTERTRAVSSDFRNLVMEGTDPVRSLWSWTPSQNSEEPGAAP